MYELVVFDGPNSVKRRFGPVDLPFPAFAAGQLLGWPGTPEMRVQQVKTILSTPGGVELVSTLLAVEETKRVEDGGEVPFPFGLPDDPSTPGRPTSAT